MSDFDVIGTIRIDDQGNLVLDKTSSTLSQVEAKAGSASGGISGLGITISVFLGKLAADAVEHLAGAFAGLVAGMISNSDKLERTINSLNASIISTGDASGLTGSQIMQLATRYQDLFQGSQLTALSVERQLMTFKNINENAYPQAIQLVADMAAKMGTDATSAAQMLGRALEEPGFGATRLTAALGVQLLPAQKKALEHMTLMNDVAGAQRVLMDALAQSVGGQAAAAADTMGGKWAILQGHISNAADEIGLHFQPFIEHMLDVVTPLMDKLLSVFEKNIEPIIDNASAWGEAIVNNFAEGMQGAMSLVVDVINEIGSLIGSLLSASSPPKFLPLLDVWGRQAVDVYLKGWTTFDKSVFDEIGKAIQAGLPSAEILKYAQTEHALYDANQAVADGQDHLNAVTLQYDQLLNPLNEKLKGLENQQQQLVDAQQIASLQLIEGSTFYSQSQRKQAALEIEKIKTKEQIATIDQQKMVAVDHAKVVLSAAQQRQKDLAEEAKLLKDQIDIQSEMTKHINQHTEAVKKLHGAMASLAGLGTGGAGAIGGLKDKLIGEVEGIRKGIAEKVALIQSTLDDFIMGMKIKFWIFVFYVEDRFRDLGTLIQKQIAIMSPVISGDVKDMLDSLKLLWQQHGDQVMWIVKIALELVATIINESFVLLTSGVTIGLDILSGKWQSAFDAIGVMHDTFWNVALALVGTDLPKFNAVWKGDLDLLLIIVQKTMDGIKAAIQGVLDFLASHPINVNANIPSQLQFESPSPLEQSLTGITRAMTMLNRTSINLVGGMGAAAAATSIINNSRSALTTTNNIYSAAPMSPLNSTNAMLRGLLGV